MGMLNAREMELWRLVNKAFQNSIEKFGDIFAKDVTRDLLDNGVTVQNWIPVSERLPEKDGIYMTFNKKKEYGFHFFQMGKSMWPAIWEEDQVTHWMPLPEPPKECE